MDLQIVECTGPAQALFLGIVNSDNDKAMEALSNAADLTVELYPDEVPPDPEIWTDAAERAMVLGYRAAAIGQSQIVRLQAEDDIKAYYFIQTLDQLQHMLTDICTIHLSKVPTTPT